VDVITRDSQVEDLLNLGGAVAWCIQRGVSPFSCSGAFPGTLGRLLELKGVADVDGFIRELNEGLAPDGAGDPGKS
jgi:hypothetical protein